MRTTWLTACLIGLTAAPSRAQLAGASVATSPQAATYFVGRRSADRQTWFKIVGTTNGLGQASLSTNVAYVELASGLNFRNPQTGQ